MIKQLSDIALWENGAPLFDADIGQPQPTITPYILEGAEQRGCVVVCPGGAYMMRADHEGSSIAKMFNAAGLNAVVLNYRVSPYRYPAELYDAQRAVRLVRARAADLGYNAEKIAIMGFSAGGHLAGMAATHYDLGIDGGDEIDSLSCRPDAAILCYGVLSLLEHTHRGSRDALLGDLPDRDRLAHELSAEMSVTPDTPPAFLWHTSTDNAVDVRNSLDYASALHANGIPFEMHVYPHGGHGLGLAENDPVISRWAHDCCVWLRGIGF